MSVIRFETAKYITEEKDVFQEYEKRFQAVLTMFVKSPFLQMTAFPLWDEILELSDSYFEKDYSKLLLKTTDNIFKKVEELQSNPKFEKVQKDIIQVIKKCNEKGIEF